MGRLLKFPGLYHARASAASERAGVRAASSTSSSAVTPPPCAVGDARTAAHQSSGIRSRCSHLRALAGGAPISDAIAPGERQRPMMDRNEVRCDMTPHLGQTVPNYKVKVSHDPKRESWDNLSMDRMSETEEKLAFIRRTKAAREARFDSQKPICTILGLDQGTYKQYESRTELPRRYIPKFIAACQVSYEWLLTGEGQGPKVTEYPREVPKRTRKPRRANAA